MRHDAIHKKGVFTLFWYRLILEFCPMHVLLIEDHLQYSEEVSSLLRKYFPGIASLRTADSFWDAVQAIQAEHPLDLVLTDTRIIQGNSVDVLCQVDRFDYHVVCMSTDQRDAGVKWLVEAGFPFYCKLDHFQKLIGLIKKEITDEAITTRQKVDRLKRSLKRDSSL